MLQVNCSLDKNSSCRTPSKVSQHNMAQNFTTESIYCEQEPARVQMKSEISLSDIISSGMSSFISSICSGPQQPMSSMFTPPMKFISPPLPHKVGGCSTFVGHQESLTFESKLTPHILHFLPGINQLCLEKCQGLADEGGVVCKNNSISVEEEINFIPTDEDELGDLSDVAMTTEPVERAVSDDDDDDEDGMDVDEDVIFLPDDSDDCSESGSESDDEDDSSDEDDDYVCFEDDCYSTSPLNICKSNSSELSFTYAMDVDLLGWDPGIDDELETLPKKFSVSRALDSSDEEDQILIQANKRWEQFYSLHSRKKKANKKKQTKEVSFACSESLVMVHSWEDLDGSRKGPWQQFAVDRSRFKRRIEEFERTFSEMLQSDRRNEALLRIGKYEMDGC